MNKLDDEIILSTPLLLALAAIYFVLAWKPRQSDTKTIARASGVFWSTIVLMVIVVVSMQISFAVEPILQFSQKEVTWPIPLYTSN